MVKITATQIVSTKRTYVNGLPFWPLIQMFGLIIQRSLVPAQPGASYFCGMHDCLQLLQTLGCLRRRVYKFPKNMYATCALKSAQGAADNSSIIIIIILSCLTFLDSSKPIKRKFL